MTAESRPTPDPTVLTTDAVERAVEAVVNLLRAELKGVEDVTQEKFASIKDQLRLIEQQRVEQKKDTKDAVDAALAAAKEAVKEQTTASERSVLKSETSFKEQLGQLTTTFNTAIDGLRREVGDLKERVSGGEERKLGGQEAKASISGGVMLALGVLTLLVMVLSVAVVVAASGP